MFHVGATPPDSLSHSYSFSPTLGVCYNLLYLFLLGDARRDATTTTTTGKYLRRCFFFSFLFFFFFFWGYLAFAGELGNLLNCAMKRNFLSPGGVGKEKLGKTIKLVQQCNGIAERWWKGKTRFARLFKALAVINVGVLLRKILWSARCI